MNNDGWILIKDGLPEKYQRVLVTIKTRKRIAVRSGTYYDGYFNNDNGECWNIKEKEVLAWRPLPKPFGESEETNE